MILNHDAAINADESILGFESTTQTTGSKALEDIERKHILSVLEETDWIIDGKRGAASILEMNPSTLQLRMKKLGIRKNKRIYPLFRADKSTQVIKEKEGFSIIQNPLDIVSQTIA